MRVLFTEAVANLHVPAQYRGEIIRLTGIGIFPAFYTIWIICIEALNECGNWTVRIIGKIQSVDE